MGFLSLCTHLKGLLLLMVSRLCIMVYVFCEELRRYFNNIIDKSLFFLVIRALANKMAKKWRRNGEVNRALAKWNRSLAKWNRSLANKMAKKMAKKSLFGEMESLFGEEMAKKMANSIALYWGFKGDTPLLNRSFLKAIPLYDIVGSSLQFF